MKNTQRKKQYKGGDNELSILKYINCGGCCATAYTWTVT